MVRETRYPGIFGEIYFLGTPDLSVIFKVERRVVGSEEVTRGLKSFPCVLASFAVNKVRLRGFTPEAKPECG